MDRRQFVREILGGLAGSLVAAKAYAQKPRPRPNILFMFTDQQHLRAMSAYGNPHLHTPAMDSIAAAGVRFELSYCTFPLCSPSRSSLLTGRMPHETGVRWNGMAPDRAIANMGQVFRAAGYHTVWGGKWHLPRYIPRPGDTVGFDFLIGGHSLGAKMDDPLGEACAQFLRQRPKQPFLLAASFMNPHDICSWIRAHKEPQAHPEVEQYPPLPPNFNVDPNEPQYVKEWREKGFGLGSQAVAIAARWTPEHWRYYLSAYLRFCEMVDRAVGKVLAALREAGLEEQTLIVFTSDHGEGMAAHRWVQKTSFYEEASKVPLIFAWKGVTPAGGVDRTHLVSGIDILPTMCDYAEIEPPAGVRGISLRPFIEGREARGHEFVVGEISRFGIRERQGRMLRTKRYKYIVFNGGENPEQLFDLSQDPGETRNLAREPAAAGILREHRALLAQWIADTGDDFVPPA